MSDNSSANLAVSTLEDENDGNYSTGDLSLREAIALGNNHDTITFNSNLNNGEIVLSQGELIIDKSININGLGADNLTISGNNSSRVFQITDGDVSNQIDVSIEGVTIRDGNTDDGSFPEINGGGFFNQENLSLTDVALINNIAGNGGAIYNNSLGHLQLRNSILAENSDGSGAIYNDGGFTSVFNTTFVNNNNAGIGAIVNTSSGELELANSTITNNNAFDAAVFNGEDSTASVTSTIIADNSGQVLPERDDVIGTFVSNGNNLIGNINGGNGFNLPSDIVGTSDNPIDPKLGELQDNGGSTETLALLEGSPAIDAGSNPNNLSTDQRGDGFSRTVGNGTDIGAYELQTPNNIEEIIGTADNDFLQGGSQSDRILGLDGNDLIEGLDGNDFLSGGNGNDFMRGGNGNDTVNGDAGNDLINGDAGDDLLRGGDGRDRIFGSSGVDTIDDGTDNDVLSGGDSGDRFLASNSGFDQFTGGSGNDIYIYNFNSDTGFDRDLIRDFNQSQDKIAFRPFNENFDSFDDLDTNDSGILDQQDERIQILGGSTVIDFSDVFGNSNNTDTLTLTAVTNLNSNNFLFNETLIAAEFS